MRTVIIPIRVTKFASEDQPGWVWCEVKDIHGNPVRFLEKIPVVTTEDVWSDSQYPFAGEIECDLIGVRNDEIKGKVATVKVAVPKKLESYREAVQFEVLLPQETHI